MVTVGFGLLAGVLVAAVGLAAVVLATAPGHDALRRFALDRLRSAVDGTVRIGSVGGSLWRTADLRDIALATSDGRTVIRAERLRVSFGLLDLVRGRYRFGNVTLVRPVLVLEQERDGHWNIERLFRLLEPDSGPPGARPFVELRRAVIVDGTVVIRQRPDGGEAVVERTARGLDLTLRRLRASHPDSSAVVARLDRLKAVIRNPDLELLEGDGEVSLDGDSLRFALDHVTMPGSRLAAAGTVRWGAPRATWDVTLDAARLAFADLRGLRADLPAGGARLAVRARGLADGGTDVDVRELDLRTGRSAVSGRAQLTLGPRGGVNVRGLDLALAPLDLALLAPYVDSLPARGLVRGRIRGRGALGDLAVDADLRWSDERVVPAAPNALVGAGRLALGGRDELVFRGFRVAPADLDARTIAGFAPAVTIGGRLRLAGVLDGPWRSARFAGAAQHLGPPGEATGVHGAFTLVLRDSVAVDADLAVDSLSLDLLRRTWPAIPAAGVVAGRVRLNGPLDALNVDARLAGAAGALGVIGRIGVGDAAVTLALDGTFDSLDLHRVAADAPPSGLAGAWSLALSVPTDTTHPATGTLRVTLRPGQVAGVGLDRGGLLARLEPAFIAADSLRLDSPAGVVTASGSFGRGPGPAGQASFTARSDTLGYLEPLVRWFRRAAGDTADVRLDGAGVVSGRISGTVAAWTVRGSATVSAAEAAGAYVRGLHLSGEATRGARGLSLDLSGSADSIAWGGLGYAPVGLALSGPIDSLGASLSAGFARSSAVSLRASIWGDSVMRVVNIDSLRLELPVRSWRLARPAGVALTADVMVFDTVELQPEGGASGRIYADGLLPRAGVGDFRLAVESLAVADLFALVARDTAGVGGAMDLTVHVAGPAQTPSMEVALVLLDGRFGDYRAPLIQLLARYSEQQLTMKGGLWRDSVRVIAINGALPLDLALAGVDERRLPGPISVVARSDSAALSLFNPLTTVARNLSGDVSLDVSVGGTWTEPRLSGHVDIRDGAMTVPALGARYTGMDVRLDLRRDSIIVTRGHLGGGQGTLDVAGTVVLGDSAAGAVGAGTRPRLDLVLRAAHFQAFDLREFGRLTGSGDLRLRGPFYGATLRGRLVVDAGYLKFADLVQKRVVSLDDPEFRAIVDSNLARAQDLGPDVQTVFLDSLRIDSLAIVMGPDVWLRSSEANVQLSGDFTVDRAIVDRLPRYRLDGALQAVRGTYRLVLGPQNLPGFTKEFRVQRGTVRFYGTPDFNPDLDIVAEHGLRTQQGQQMTVRALIGGTLLYPRLRLESDARPPLTETEVVSYLITGGPPSAGSGSLGQAGLTGVLSGVAGEFGQSLISELGLPLDYLTIVPGSTTRGGSRAAGLLANARIGAGAQLGPRTFLSLTAGLCESSGRTFGASLEYRLSRPWSLSTAFEPLAAECGASALSGISSRYQFSLDLFWQQGFR